MLKVLGALILLDTAVYFIDHQAGGFFIFGSFMLLFVINVFRSTNDG